MANLETLTRRWFQEVWNECREATIDELLSKGAVILGLDADGEPGVGVDHFKKFFQLFRAGLSNIHVTVNDVVHAGDKSAARLTFTARHSGDGFGVNATGREIRVTGMVMMRWSNGQVVEAWNEFDSLGMMKQITQMLPGVELKA